MPLLEIDNLILQAVQSANHAYLDYLMPFLTFLGNPVFWIFIAALIYWRGKEKESFFLMNIILFAGAIVSLLKMYFLIPRPTKEQFMVISDNFFGNYAAVKFPDYSFPSGHAVLISSYYFHLSNFVRKRKKQILLIALIVVAYSRLYLGMHFLSDVIAGLILGFAIGKINFILKKRLEKAHFKLTKLGEELGLVATMIMAFFVFALFEPPVLAMVLFGYYAGFFMFKQGGGDSPLLKGKKLWLKEIIGVLTLTIISFPAFYLTEISLGYHLALFFLIGFWISFLYPFLYNKVFKVKRR